MTDQDPIVEEARKAGQAYIDSFGGNLKAVMEDLRKRTEARRREGWEVVSLPPQRVEPAAEGSKKVG